MRQLVIVIIGLFLTTSLYAAEMDNVGGMFETRFVKSKSIDIYEEPDRSSRIVGTLVYLDELTVVLDQSIPVESGVWLKTIAPIEGFVFQSVLLSGAVILTETQSDQSLDSTIEDNTSEMSRANDEPSSNGTYKFPPRWMGVGLGVFVLPQQQGYSSELLSPQEFMLEFEDDGTWQSKLRFGASLSNFSGANTLYFLNLFGAYRYDFNVPVFQGFDLYAFGGAYLSFTNITGSVSGSSTGFGAIIGVGSYYDLQRHGFSELMKGGLQFLYTTGSTTFGSLQQGIGCTQIQVFALWKF